MYSSVTNENDTPWLRSFCISEDFEAKIVDLDYGVWNKDELKPFTDWLKANGFRLTDTMKETGHSGKETLRTYSRQGRSIHISEEPHTRNGTTRNAYIVKINSRDY